MAPKATVLDASALVALIRGESGWETVEQVARTGASRVTATGLAETLIVLRRKGYRASSEEIVRDIHALGIAVEPVTEEDAAEMAFLSGEVEKLRARNARGANQIGMLSLGDSACLAVAKRLGAIAVVSDGTWELLGPVGITIMPFR